jgi:hypothetical protein
MNEMSPQEYEIDLLELAAPWRAPDMVDYSPKFAWEGKAMTEKQTSALRRNGVDLTPVRDRGIASVILSKLFTWLERELASQTQKVCCHFLWIHFPGN